MKTHKLKKGLIPLTIFLILIILLGVSVNALYIGITDCTEASSIWNGIGQSEIEWEYNIEISGVAENFYMAFNKWFAGTDPLNSFTLYINGVDCGQPFEWFTPMINSTCDTGSCTEMGAMHWTNLEHVIFNNEIVLFEVVHDYGTKFKAHRINSSDIDGDGDNQFRYSSSSSGANGVYDGTVNPYDILYVLEYNETIPVLVNDSLFVSPDEIEQDMGIPIYYTIDSLGFQNYINISCNDVFKDSYVITQKVGWITYYNTSEIGDYVVTLTRQDNIKAFDNFTVTASYRDWYIKFYPNPVDTGSIVKGEVWFNFTAYDGTLINRITDEEFFCPRDKTTTFTFNSGVSGVKPFDLYGTSNGTKIDYIGTENLYVGALSLDATLIVWQHSIHVDHGVPNDIWGAHNLLGTNIRIDIIMNDVIIDSIPVGHAQIIRERHMYYPRTTLGTVYYKLIFNDMILAYDTCIIIGAETPETLIGLPEDYMNAMFGAFFTLGFLIIPFALSKGKASNIIYAIFGGIGLGISTIVGFFPLWLPLMITILVVAVMIFEYKKS